MVSSNCFILDSVLFVCTLYLCKFIGILPFRVDGKDFTVQSILQKTTDVRDDFTPPKTIYLCNLTIAVLSLFIVLWYHFAIEFTIKEFLKYGLIMNSFPPYILLGIVLFKRRKSTVKCIYSASRIYCMSLPSLKPCWFILISLFFHLFAFFGVHFLQHFNIALHYKMALVELILLPTFATSLLICCLCLVAERAYINLNMQLRELMESRPSSKTCDQVQILMFHHEVVTDMMDEVSNCFSYDLLTLLADFTLQLILSSYALSRHTVDHKSYSSLTVFASDMLVMFLCLYKFFMVCNCSQQVQKQVELMKINLHSIKVHWLNYNDINLETLLSDFSGVVEARPAILSAAGFTDIDLSLIFKLGGTAVMYASAALQYHWQDGMN